MENNDLPMDLGDGVEVLNKLKDGRYIIRYITPNGKYNMIAWSKETIPGIEYEGPADDNAKQAMIKAEKNL